MRIKEKTDKDGESIGRQADISKHTQFDDHFSLPLSFGKQVDLNIELPGSHVIKNVLFSQ